MAKNAEDLENAEENVGEVAKLLAKGYRMDDLSRILQATSICTRIAERAARRLGPAAVKVVVVRSAERELCFRLMRRQVSLSEKHELHRIFYWRGDLTG